MAMGAVVAATDSVDLYGRHRDADPLGHHAKNPRRENQATTAAPTQLAAEWPPWPAIPLAVTAEAL